jgi:hypothetical protein
MTVQIHGRGIFDGSDIEHVIDVTNYADSPMLVEGGEVTKGTNAGTFKVAALSALIRKTDSAIGELDYVTKAEEDNIAITLADTLYYVIVNYNGGSPTVSIISSLQNFNDKIPIGSVMKSASNAVHYISGCYRLQSGVAKLHYRAFELYQLYLTSGNTITYSGTNNFKMIEGVVYEGINRLTQTAYNSATDTFDSIYKDGIGGWTTNSVNVIDYEHYDDGDGTLGNIGVAKYGCHWVYRHVDDGDVYVLYGTDSYTAAEAEVAQVPTGPDHLTNFGCLIGKIIAPQAGGSFYKVQMVTDTVFSGVSVATHNNLGGLNDGDYKHLTAAQYATTIIKNVTIKGITDDTALTTGDGKTHFTVPIELNGMNLVSVGAHVYTTSSSGLPNFQIHNLTDAVDMLSTALTIDATELDSKDATTAAVINTVNDDVATGDVIRLDCDAAGTGTKGMEIRLGFELP